MMKQKEVRVGIIGCGGIAFGKHMPSLAKLDHVKMTAFSNPTREKAVKAAEKFGTEGAKVYTDYRELLKDDSISCAFVLRIGPMRKSPLQHWNPVNMSCVKSPWQ